MKQRDPPIVIVDPIPPCLCKTFQLFSGGKVLLVGNGSKVLVLGNGVLKHHASALHVIRERSNPAS
ncbi:hypothetical protein BGX21_006091 [Mortierella sp. AD011]|nr:hypothetical protein BGX21_006091 [Mortierella sp. AD011]